MDTSAILNNLIVQSSVGQKGGIKSNMASRSHKVNCTFFVCLNCGDKKRSRMGGGDYCAGFGCSNSRRKPDRYRVNIFVNKASRGYILSVSFIVICAGI